MLTPAEVVYPALLLLLLLTGQLARTLIQWPHSSNPSMAIGNLAKWAAWWKVTYGPARYRPRHRRR